MTIISIDFGTSNTVISILDTQTQKPRTLRFSQISRIYRLKNNRGKTWQFSVIPSIVFVEENNKIILGEKVKSLRLDAKNPKRFFKKFKRDLAADFQSPSRYIDGNVYDSKIVAELFITQIWEYLKQQNINASEVVFTVPIGAYERYLDWFMALATKLKIPQVKLLDESTAAALGYGIENPNQIVLVLDFGGGTLDLSLVRIIKNQGIANNNSQIFKAEILAKSDAYIGGEDIDIWIVEDYLRSQNLTKNDINEVAWQNLLEIAEKLKIRLSYEHKVQEIWLNEDDFTSYELELTRHQLTAILENQQLLEQLRYALDEILHLALSKGIKKAHIEQVLLVGGSCFIPAIQQLIISYFGKQKVKFHKPFNAVSHGALAISNFSQIDDYLHHSYGIRLWDHSQQSYSYFPLFEKGVHYPCHRKKPLILQVAMEGQTEIKLDIGELAEVATSEVNYDDSGRLSSSFIERKHVYRSLEISHQEVCIGHLNPPGRVGIDRISADFEINQYRVLLITVKDLLNEQILVNKQAIAKLK